MFYKVSDFIAEWTNESANTQKILDALTDASLTQAVAPDHRTLGELAWHLTGTHKEMMPLTGLQFDGSTEHEPVPASAQAIAHAYKQVSKALSDAVQTQWTDESLAQTSNLYGESWANGLTLRILIQHEVHHRGQMTVLMRQAGLRVPGVYGPAKEEWSQPTQ